jgi:hypothetical protein
VSKRDELLTSAQGSDASEAFFASSRHLTKVEQAQDGACLLGHGARENECGHANLQCVIPLHETFERGSILRVSRNLPDLDAKGRIN